MIHLKLRVFIERMTDSQTDIILAVILGLLGGYLLTRHARGE